MQAQRVTIAPCTQLTEQSHRAVEAQHQRERRGEVRTRIVTGLTLITMVAEIVCGFAFGSMALLADGWHMASHAAAFAITLFAYAYARRHADDPRYSFGTGKVNALGAFASAVLLACIAVGIVYESIERFVHPGAVLYTEALVVAVIGLVVNGVSAFLLRDVPHDHGHGHGHDHGHGHSHSHAHDEPHPHDHDHGHAHGAHNHAHDQHPHANEHHAHDSNLKAAYLHVLADALTSVLAIAALLAGKYWGFARADSAVGFLGAIVILKWSYGLVKSTSRELLDADVPPAMLQRVRDVVQTVPDTRVVDLHVWRLGPQRHAAIVSVVSDASPDVYKKLLAEEPALAHVTVEVNPR